MSILIKDMEMPDGCVVCPFFIENCHDRGDDSLCRASGKEAKCGCPLIEIPPHGRLIDADAVEKQIDYVANLDWNKKVGVSGGMLAALEIVEDALTIIEAEGGE